MASREDEDSKKYTVSQEDERSKPPILPHPFAPESPSNAMPPSLRYERNSIDVTEQDDGAKEKANFDKSQQLHTKAAWSERSQRHNDEVFKEIESSLGENAHDLLEKKVPVDIVQGIMRQNVRDDKLYSELLLFIPFLVMFMLFSLNDISIQEAHMSVGALRDTFSGKLFPIIPKQTATIWSQVNNSENPSHGPNYFFDRIDSLGTWLEWLNMTINEIYHCNNSNLDEPNVEADLGLPRPFKGQLYPIGAMLVRTMRVRDDSCEVPSDVISETNATGFADYRCWASHTSAAEETASPRCNFKDPFGFNESMYQYKSCSAIGGVPTTTDQGYYDCGGYVAEFPFNATCRQALWLWEKMQDPACPFVDGIATRFIIAEMFFYSPSLDVHFSAKLITELTSGGAWITTTQYRVFIFQTVARTSKIVLEFVLLIFVIYYFMKFFLDIREFYLEQGLILKYFSNIAVWLDFVNVCLYIVLFILRWIWWGQSNTVHYKLPLSYHYPPFDDTLYLYSQFRYIMAFNIILTFLKILKYLKLSQKLNIITVTLERSQSDVIGLMVIFVLIIMGYSLAGMSLYGHDMREFSSFDRAISALMFMLLGVTDYNRMKEVNRSLTAIYFWSYIIISFFLLLNFIVAVVSEAFAQAGQEEFVPPLVESTLRTLDDLFIFIKPSTWGSKIKLRYKYKKNITELRAQVLNYVEQLQTVLQLAHPGAHTIEITGHELLKFMPLDVRKQYSMFFAQEWSYVLWWADLLQNSDEEQLELVRKAAIIDGVRKVAKDVPDLLRNVFVHSSRIHWASQKFLEKYQEKMGVNLSITTHTIVLDASEARNPLSQEKKRPSKK